MALQPAKLKPYLLLLVVVLIAFLPVSSFYFGMKNDAFSDNFPNKFFFTEAIHSGFLPLWNPYLNFGFPIYADPGFAFWNPITWFFGAVVGYNAYTFTIEVLLYLYIAGVTMYHLGRYLHFNFHIAIAIASMYMCSGFFTGELQHINFLTGAAFLPLLLQQFLVLNDRPNYKNALLTSIAYYFVFACGHPAIPIGTIYFLIILSVSIFLSNKTIRENWKTLLLYHLLSIFVFIVLFSPAIYSYASIITTYARGGILNQMNEVTYGFSPTSYLSFLYPFATVKDASFLTDDLSMRNGYFSIAGFALVVCVFKNKNFLIRSLIIAAGVMLVLSSGGYIKGLVFSNLPLLKYIRTNGEFRIFTILCFCIIAGFGLDELEKNQQNLYARFTKIFKILLLITLLILLFSSIKSYSSVQHLFSIDKQGLIATIKASIDNLTFYNVLLISVIIQLGLILLLLVSKANTYKIVILILADLVINSIAYLPFTGVGTVRLADVQKVFNASKKGITLPPLIALENIDTFSVKKTGLVGSSSFYNKKIGITKLTDYPSYFSNTEAYFKSDWPNLVNNFPYVFLKKNIDNYDKPSTYHDSALIVDFFSPKRIRLRTNETFSDTLVLLQNKYKFWKAKVDGKEINVIPAFITFMSIPLNKGQHEVEFYYNDELLVLFTIISISSFIIVLVFICHNYFKKSSH